MEMERWRDEPDGERVETNFKFLFFKKVIFKGVFSVA